MRGGRDEHLCVCGCPYIVHPAGDGCVVCPNCVRFVAAGKRNKYNAKKKQVDGKTFDSEGEAKRHGELLWMAKAGEIDQLDRQRTFTLSVNGVVLGVYKADFVYRVVATGAWVVEDFKGFATPLYRWKKKHMAAQHGIQIQEVGGCRKSKRSSKTYAKGSFSKSSSKPSQTPSRR